MPAPRTVVGVKKFDEADYMDAWGHYWAWNPTAGHWDHDRTRCDLTGGRVCVKGDKPHLGSAF